MEKPLVSIVILNWNGLASTQLCLESLKDLKYPKVEVILVDNGSTDGSKTKLPKLLKKIKQPSQFISLQKNTGFTGGHIAGLKASQGEIQFLLNNDSVVDPDIVNNALEIFRSDKKIAVVGGRAFFWNDANPIFNDKNQYYSFQTINPITAEVITLEEGLKQCEPNNVSGSAVFIKRSAIDEVGYLDNRFFAYYEESDLFARIKRAGYKVVYSPDIKIWHRVGESTKDKPAFFYYLIFRNQFLYAFKNFDRRFLRFFLKYYFYTFFLKAILYSALGRGQDKLMNKARLKSFFWNLFHILPTIAARVSLNRKYGPGYSDILIGENFQPIGVLVDAVNASKDKIQRTLESLKNQSVAPAEIVIVTSKELSKDILASNDRIRQVVDKKVFNTSPWNLAFICSNQEWLYLLKAGEVVDKDLLKSHLIMALRTHAGIVYPTQINNRYTPARFRVSGLKQGDSLGHNLFISKNVMRATGGLSSSSKSEPAWRFVADAILLTRTKIKQAPGRISHAETEGRQAADFTYPEFSKISDARYWVWTSPQPIGRFLRVLKAIFLSSRLATLLKVLIASLRVQPVGDEQPISLSKIAGKLILLRLRSVKSSLIFNYDLFKRQRLIVSAEEAAVDFSIANLPVFINCRDRVTDLKKLVAWLQKAGVKKIALVDNGSTYPELLDFYKSTASQVLPLGSNRGHRAPWESLAISILAKNNYYVVSDPDIIPVEDCPLDALDYFYSILQKHKEFMKVGFSLKIDDLPDHYQLKKTVVNWEKQFWQKELEPNLYIADIDTTFALYRPNMGYFLENSLRTGSPYTAKHTAWYHDKTKPSAEDRYYQLHASRAVNTWNMEDIPEHFKAAIAQAST